MADSTSSGEIYSGLRLDSGMPLIGTRMGFVLVQEAKGNFL